MCRTGRGHDRTVAVVPRIKRDLPHDCSGVGYQEIRRAALFKSLPEHLREKLARRTRGPGWQARMEGALKEWLATHPR